MSLTIQNMLPAHSVCFTISLIGLDLSWPKWPGDRLPWHEPRQPFSRNVVSEAVRARLGDGGGTGARSWRCPPALFKCSGKNPKQLLFAILRRLGDEKGVFRHEAFDFFAKQSKQDRNWQRLSLDGPKYFLGSPLFRLTGFGWEIVFGDLIGGYRDPVECELIRVNPSRV